MNLQILHANEGDLGASAQLLVIPKQLNILV